MALSITSPALKTANFTVGVALLVMLFPVNGKLPDKPAGVRNSIEMISKKPTLKVAALTAAISA
jgi:hypothetical protein